MKPFFRQITGILFILVFVVNGAAPLIQLLPLSASKQDIEELFTKTESENSGKEKEEKTVEEELFHYRVDFHLQAINAIDIKKCSAAYISRWQNVFPAISTPPPELA